METNKKLVLGSSLAAALATSALVAGLAFAAPGNVTSPVQPAAVKVAQSAVASPTESNATANDGDNIQNENGADDATEAKGEKSKGEKEASSAEADGIDHQFNGEEVGNNGNGVPDAHEAAETK